MPSLQIFLPNGGVLGNQMYILDPNTQVPVPWDGTITVGSITIGTVDQGTGGASAWLVTGPLTDTQLRASAVPVSVSGTVTVSGSVTANAGTNLNTSALATSTKQSDGSQKSQVVDGSGNVIGSTSNALDINIKSGNPTSIAATQSGTWNVGTVTTITNVVHVDDNSGSLTVDGTITASNATGNVAHDGVDSGNPVKIGGYAVNAEPTAVANADRANFITDLVGKQIVLPYANPENLVSGAITSAMTGTTSTSLIGAPASGLRNYITQVTVSNSHATVGTDIILQDGSGGTTLYTIPAAANYGGSTVTFPSPLRQPTTATALYCANVTTGASTKVSACGYKGA